MFDSISYIKHQLLYLDFFILLKTLRHVVALKRRQGT